MPPDFRAFIQNRYQSTVVEDEPYFLRLIRYIHLNSVRAGLVNDLQALAQWPWSGHRVLMGTKTTGTNQLIQAVCTKCRISQSEITGRRRRPLVVKARQTIAYLAVRRLGCTTTETGLLMGMTRTAIGRAANQGEKALETIAISADALLSGLS